MDTLKEFILRKSEKKYFQHKNNEKDVVQIKNLILKDMMDPATFAVQNPLTGERKNVDVSEFHVYSLISQKILKKVKRKYYKNNI